MPKATLSPPSRAFTVDKVVKLTGLSRRQVQYWDEQGFLSPSISRNQGRGRNRLYDFRDLVSLRVAAQLRRDHGISLQQIRKMVGHLRGLDYAHPLAEITVFVVGETLYFREENTVRAARRPEQILATFNIPFEPIVHSLEAAVARLDHARPTGTLENRRGTLRSATVIAGTRIPISAIQRMVDAGMTVAQIREEYPDLRVADVRAARRITGRPSSHARNRAS